MFGHKTLILALLDPFLSEIVGNFPWRRGYPPFLLRVFWQNDFPQRGYGIFHVFSLCKKLMHFSSHTYLAKNEATIAQLSHDFTASEWTILRSYAGRPRNSQEICIQCWNRHNVLKGMGIPNIFQVWQVLCKVACIAPDLIFLPCYQPG